MTPHSSEPKVKLLELVSVHDHLALLVVVLQVTDEPLVSSDLKGNDYSSIFSSLDTLVLGNMVKVVAWYDNEWGYACRVADLAAMIAALRAVPPVDRAPVTTKPGPLAALLFMTGKFFNNRTMRSLVSCALFYHPCEGFTHDLQCLKLLIKLPQLINNQLFDISRLALGIAK